MKVIKLTMEELEEIISDAWEAGLNNCMCWSASDYFSRQKNQSKIIEVPQEEM